MAKVYLKFVQKLILNDKKFFLIKQFCKNILLFISILCYLNKKTVSKTTNLRVKIFILPKEQTSHLLLKAPFVNKLAKKHYCIRRFKFIVSFNFSVKNNFTTKFCAKIHHTFSLLLNVISFFESNVYYNYKIIISYPLLFKI